MTPRVTWSQALAWRLGRQMRNPVARVSVPDVVRRLCRIQAQVASSAELAVMVRQESSKPGEMNRALADGLLIKTWAMRAILHLLDPRPPPGAPDPADLALRSSGVCSGAPRRQTA